MVCTGEQKREYDRRWVRARRMEWVLANGPCVVCGSSEDPEVDHIDPAHKKIATRSLWTMSPTNPKRIAELAKCQVLCHWCHVEKTNREIATRVKGCPSSAAYKRGCRCQGCKAARAEYVRQLRTESKAVRPRSKGSSS